MSLREKNIPLDFLQQFQPRQHAFVLIIHELAKDHLSLANIQDKSFFKHLELEDLALESTLTSTV